MSTLHTLTFAKNGQVSIPLQAVVGSTLTICLPITAICPNCTPLLEAARAAYGYICELEEIGHADHPFADIGSSKDCLLCEAMMILRADIAAAERGNA